jgi:hypothetical protein
MRHCVRHRRGAGKRLPRFPVALEKFLAVSQSMCFYTTGLSHLSIPLTD